MSIALEVEPLTKAAFATFGDVVEMVGATPITINKGFAQRFNDLAHVDVHTEGGETSISLFAAKARTLPLTIDMMERHPLGSQMFYPLQDRTWLVIVCADPEVPASFRAFAADGSLGVNYAAGTWHFPLVTFDSNDRFIVVDRKGPGVNLHEVTLSAPLTVSL